MSDFNDLVKRIRDTTSIPSLSPHSSELLNEAADAITELNNAYWLQGEMLKNLASDLEWSNTELKMARSRVRVKDV